MNKNEVTNPAHRARLFVEHFTAASVASEGIRVKLVRHALANVYDLEPTDNSSLMTVLSDVWKLPGQIRVDLGRSGLNEEDFVDALKSLEGFLKQLNLDSQAQAVRNNIPQNLISSLRMISGMLNKDVPEAVLSEDKTNEILESIDALEKDIRKSKFEDIFTDFLLHKVGSIRYAVSHYDTLGQEELMARVDQMFGGVIRQYAKLADGKRKTDLVNRLLRIGAVIVYAISAFNGAVELPENINKLLGEGVIQNAEIIIESPAEIPNPSDKIA